jgi:CDGSH-type Zn-finger protein/uncharacterized Fe-S cluster protein YjdI
MANEPDIIVHDREQLIALLTEAAEIEHGLMCCYLFAAFSLKTGDDCGLNPDQLAATRRWRGIILDVAIEEMLHLGLVANLMSAVGATPHFARPNFPVAPGYHPSGVTVELSRFCKESVDHFVYLERPEGIDLPDGAGFATAQPYVRATRRDVLVPSAQDFLTVGYLYRAVENGFAQLSGKLGAAALFLGAPRAQMTPEISGFAELIRVTDLASARAAIEAIVEQGEGSPGHSENSHYVKFCAIQAEFAAMRAADPGFDPAWLTARNPVMRKPPTPDGKVHITAPEAAKLLDIGNATYGLMLRCLMGAFGQPAASDEDRRVFYSTAIDLMHAVAPLAERLAQLPATSEGPVPTAGLTFTLPRSITPIADPAVARHIIAERASEIAQAAATSAHVGGHLGPVSDALAHIAAALTRTNSVPPVPARGAMPVAAELGDEAVALPVRAVNQTPPLEEAIGQDVTIRFDGKRCIHARFCVVQAPKVFKANTPGNWIDPDAMDVEHLVAVAENCPSGAITYLRHDKQQSEAPPPVNLARLRENGPYAIHADIELADSGSMLRATLCRCGASQNKPFCDGSHVEAGFVASGEPATRPSEPLASRAGALSVALQRNGPLIVSGPLEILSGTGRTVDRVTSARLCRCGGSANKPFCDGSHTRVGFRAE